MKRNILQSYTLQFIYSFFFRIVLSFFNRIRYDESNVFKKANQFIIIANHRSHLDTIKILSVLPKELLWKVKPVAAQDYFGNTKFKRFLSNFFINTLLINRNQIKDNDANPITRMISAVKEGYSLILYPEGTRKNGGQMKEVKSGVAHVLLAHPDIPYIPIYIQNDLMVVGNITFIKGLNVKNVLEEIKSQFVSLSNR